jgi:hypothetical protein
MTDTTRQPMTRLAGWGRGGATASDFHASGSCAMVSMCVMARAALKTSAGASAPSGAVGAIESVDAIATCNRSGHRTV